VIFYGSLSFAVTAPGTADLTARLLCVSSCGSPLFATEISSSLGDSTRSFLFSQVLPAGAYTVETFATGGGVGVPRGPVGVASLNYSVELAVPEPSLLLLTASGLLALRGRRRSE
jgi:hypothetical protein